MTTASFDASLLEKKRLPGEKLIIFSLGFFSLLLIVDYFLNRNKDVRLLPLNLLIIFLFVKLPSLRSRFLQKPLWRFVLEALPLAGYAYLYKLAGSLVFLFGHSWKDELLAKLDRVIFGFNPNLAVTRYYSPWLTEILMFAYVAYLPLVVALAYIYFRNKDEYQLQSYIFTLGIAYVSCFFLFILIPAASPRFFFSGNQPATGFFFRRLMTLVEATGQYRGGSFPSAHCAAGTVMIFYAWRAGRKIFALVFPLILLFFLSTVYGQYHYVVDVLGGILLGLMAMGLGRLFQSKEKTDHFSQER